jgi:glycosyltransferase involved in cell wall biosynthesis
MRVCHVGFNYFPGQGLTIFYEFARHQAMQGIEVVVVAPGRLGEPERENVGGMTIFRVPTPSLGRLSGDRLGFLRQAARIIRRQPVDLVHAYAFVGAGLLPWLAGRRHALWLYDCQTGAIKPPLLGLQNWLIRLESYSFDAVTALSAGIRDIVFGPSRAVEAIVPLGADLDHFRPRSPDPALLARLGIATTDCVLVYCGTLDHNRRMEKLLAAFAFAAAREPAAKLLVVGDGSALDELKAQARELKLEKRIIFTGFAPYREIPDLLAAASVALAFISMDACFEHQPPTKTAEYLAQGLPVIATATAGNRVFVQQDVNGLLCADGAEAFGQAMLDLVRDPLRRQRLAANARPSVLSFDWAEIVRAQVIPLYARLLRDHRRDR